MRAAVATRYGPPEVTYALDEIVDAYRYVETGRKIGNVVLEVVRG
ncbi:hypothetical protein [Georgenia yuyongxinii]